MDNPEMTPRTGTIFSGTCESWKEQARRWADGESDAAAGEGDHESEQAGVPESAARSDQIGRDDGLTVAGRERVHGAEADGGENAQGDELRREVAAVEELREVVAADDRSGSGGLLLREGGARRSGGLGSERRGRNGCGGAENGPVRRRRELSREGIGRGDVGVGGIAGESVADVFGAGSYDFFPSGAARVVFVVIKYGAGFDGRVGVDGDAQGGHAGCAFGGGGGDGIDDERKPAQPDWVSFSFAAQMAACARDLVLSRKLIVPIDLPLVEKFEGGDLGEIEDG